ncbi:MAG: hypothetical protein OHK0015_32750 [Chloroflexi bacterium OHK40]
MQEGLTTRCKAVLHADVPTAPGGWVTAVAVAVSVPLFRRPPVPFAASMAGCLAATVARYVEGVYRLWVAAHGPALVAWYTEFVA